MRKVISFLRGRPKCDGEYLVIEDDIKGYRFHIYNFTVEGGWCTFRNNDGEIVPSGVDHKKMDELFSKDIVCWIPTACRKTDTMDWFDDIAYEIGDLMHYVGESDPDVFEALADSLDKFEAAQDMYERGSEE